MIKILFLIRDLGQGGAEKVLVNLVNNMDPSKFDISVTVLFGGGVNQQFLAPHIHFRAVWKHSLPGNSKLMKLLSPRQLHRLCVKEHYDIEVSYLEGPSARIISGCPHKDTKLVSWIHTEFLSQKAFAAPFRSYQEALDCYHRFHHVACVSRDVLYRFQELSHLRENCSVLYNTIESEKILSLSQQAPPFPAGFPGLRFLAMGTLKEVKGFDRLLRVMKRLKDDHHVFHLSLLGTGPLESSLKAMLQDLNLSDCVTMVGYEVNPYPYLRQCDLFLCSSHTEGFSTAATESLILGVPVCTVEVSGMKEMLGEHNEYGIVTENDETALYYGIKRLLEDPQLLRHYTTQAALRGKAFRTEETVYAVERMLLSL